MDIQRFLYYLLIMATFLGHIFCSHIKRNKGSLCHVMISVSTGIRSMCAPLHSIWILRHGKCTSGLSCSKGYTQKECIRNCMFL